MNETNLEVFKRELEGMLERVKKQEAEKGQAGDGGAMFFAGARYAYQHALDILNIVFATGD